MNKQGEKQSPSQTLVLLEPQLNSHLKAGRLEVERSLHTVARDLVFSGLYRDVQTTSQWECYKVWKTENKIFLSEVTLQTSTQYGESPCGNQKKQNVPYLRSSVCASWHGFSPLLESWTHCYCLDFPRIEKDKNSSFHWDKNLTLLYILISTTALSLAQYRCLMEHWEKYRYMWQIQKKHQICWSLRSLFTVLSSSIF